MQKGRFNMANIYAKGKGEQLSKNFKSLEFDCKCNQCSLTKIDPLLVGFLQKIRDHFNTPVVINSAYRCAVHNGKVGGAKNSKHLYGSAADIVVKGVEPIEVAKYAESIGVFGIGLYDTFVHIDTRISKSFWYSHSQEYRATFLDASLIKRFQTAALADGFTLMSGADGIWGKECEAVANKAILKKRVVYKYKNLTKLIQKCLGVTADGKFGTNTKNAVINFQKQNGLNPDGIVGVNTYKRLLGV